MTAGGASVSFLQGCDPREAIHAPGDGLPMHTQAAHSVLGRFINKAHEVRRGKGEGIGN